VDSKFVGFWIDLAPDERSLALHEELSSKDGRVIAVSPDTDAYPGGFAVSCGLLPEAYRIFHPMMVVHLAGYCAAEAPGHAAGRMRYLKWLVK